MKLKVTAIELPKALAGTDGVPLPKDDEPMKLAPAVVLAAPVQLGSSDATSTSPVEARQSGTPPIGMRAPAPPVEAEV